MLQPRKRCNSKIAIWISCICGIALLWALVSLVITAEKRIVPTKNNEGTHKEEVVGTPNNDDNRPPSENNGGNEEVEATMTTDTNNRGDEGDAEDIFLRANCDGEPLQPQISTLPTGKKNQTSDDRLFSCNPPQVGSLNVLDGFNVRDSTLLYDTRGCKSSYRVLESGERMGGKISKCESKPESLSGGLLRMDRTLDARRKLQTDY